MSSIVSDHVTTQEYRLTPEASRLSATISGRSWQRLVAIIALVGMLLAALVVGWIAPEAHGAGVLAATTTPHTATIAPHIVCGALSLPC